MSIYTQQRRYIFEMNKSIPSFQKNKLNSSDYLPKQNNVKIHTSTTTNITTNTSNTSPRTSILNKNNKYLTKQKIRSVLEQCDINLPINNLALWQQAFTHKSYQLMKTTDIKKLECFAGENIVELQKDSNERLEWLGDAQVQSAITQFLFLKYPNEDEGFLTKLRSKLVKTDNLSYLATTLGFNDYILMSNHVEYTCNGRTNLKILENTFEAFIGAMYLDFSNSKEITNYAYGSEVVRRFLINAINKYVDISALISNDDNYKDILMWYFQKNFNGVFPVYNCEQANPETGVFNVCVLEPNTNTIVGKGHSKTKKKAEQLAAHSAIKYYGIK